MVAADEIAVFVDTTLGTRLALSVHPECSVGDLKRDLKAQHCSCFPSIGDIKVQSMMVKKKSTFYHLPDLMPIKVFQTFHRTCFFHMVASPFSTAHNEDQCKRMKVSKDIAREIVQDRHGTIDIPQTTEVFSDVDFAKEKNAAYKPTNDESSRPEQSVEGFKAQQKSVKSHDQSSSPLQKFPRSVSEEISVTSLISKYFFDGGEINSFSILHSSEVNAGKTKLQCKMDAEETTTQCDKAINHDSVGCQTGISDFSAKHESSNRLYLNFNTSASREFKNETSAFSHVRCSNTILHGTTRDPETFSVEPSSFSRFKNTVSGNKIFKSVERKKTPHSSSKFSSKPYLVDRLDASTIRAAKYEVGKRLSCVASRIWSPKSANRSSKYSSFVNRVNHSTCKPASLVKRFSFESSDSAG